MEEPNNRDINPDVAKQFLHFYERHYCAVAAFETTLDITAKSVTKAKEKFSNFKSGGFKTILDLLNVRFGKINPKSIKLLRLTYHIQGISWSCLLA